jgi:hypothetical protein
VQVTKWMLELFATGKVDLLKPQQSKELDK